MSLQVSVYKALKGFTLNVDLRSPGGTLGILGASGSGKSMTLRCIAGIETPDRGKIVVEDTVLFDSEKRVNLKPQKRKIGYLFQHYALFPHMTVEKNIGCAFFAARENKRLQPKRIDDILRLLQLEGLEKRYPAQLSGGQQQRVALARILAGEPRALLLDEPFSALDAYLREKLQVELRELLRHFLGDIVMVTHSRDEVYKLCQGLLVMEAGQSLIQGDTKEIFQNPRILPAARLTGCKNLSRVRLVNEQEVEALDWGFRFRIPAGADRRIDYIGIRAHDFKPVYPGDETAENRIPIRVTERMEGPFEWNMLCVNAHVENPGIQHKIWWMCDKETMLRTDPPPYLTVRPERILLLRAHG